MGPGRLGPRGRGSGGVRAALAGPPQLTPRRRQRGKRAGRAGAPWTGRSPVPAARPGPAGPGARTAAAAARATGAARGLGGGAAGPAAGPAPRAPGPAPSGSRLPRWLPRAGPGSGLREPGCGLRAPLARLSVFQAAEGPLTELRAPPRPTPPGPSARPGRGPSPGGTSPQARVGDEAGRGQDRAGEEVSEEGFWKLVVNPFPPAPSHTHRYTPQQQFNYIQARWPQNNSETPRHDTPETQRWAHILPTTIKNNSEMPTACILHQPLASRFTGWPDLGKISALVFLPAGSFNQAPLQP